LKSAVLGLGSDVTVHPTKMYIAFRRNKGFAGVVVLRSKLKVYLNIDISQLKDPFKKARDVRDIGHYSHGDTELVISERNEIPEALSLIKQAYERN
jgi:predicted transport protein